MWSAKVLGFGRSYGEKRAQAQVRGACAVFAPDFPPMEEGAFA
jgi:hypothetical protein